MRINYKKGLTVKDWVIASLVFGGVWAMGILMIGGFALQSGIANNMTDNAIAAHYSTLDQNLNTINQSIGALNQPGGMTLTSGFQAFFGGTVSVLTLVLNSWTIIPNIFINFASDFGVPSSVTVLFFTIGAAVLSVIILFAILNAGKGTGRV